MIGIKVVSEIVSTTSYTESPNYPFVPGCKCAHLQTGELSVASFMIGMSGSETFLVLLPKSVL